MNQKLIVIDGKTYKSVDEMPEDVRRNYENAMMQSGTNTNPPGVLNVLAGNNSEARNTFETLAASIFSATKIVADGKAYNSLDELPPDVRARYEQAMTTLDKDRNGVPDILEGMINAKPNVQNTFATSAPPPASSQPIPVTSTMEPESSDGFMLALVGFVLIGLCIAGAAGIWYYFMR